MRVLVLGGDGYLGWPTSMALSVAGHDVACVDNYLRRTIAKEMGSEALVDNPLLPDRAAIFERLTKRSIDVAIGDCRDFDFLGAVFARFKPDAVIHYAEQPS